MKTIRYAASALALALIASVFVATAPASAAQNLFGNPAATPQTNNLDVTQVTVDYTNDQFVFGATTENFSPTNGYSLSVYVTPTQQPLSAQPFYFTFTSVVTPTSAVVYEYFTQDGTTSGPVTVANAYSSVDPANKTVTLTVPPLGLFSNTTIFTWASLSDGVTAATAGIPAAGGTLGFGPIHIASIPTVTGLRVSSPSQVYGSTPAVAFITVGPSTARGTVSVLDGAAVLATADFLGNDVSVNLPVGLGLGNHQLTAVFTPTDATLYDRAVSSPVSFSVLSPGTKTSTSLSLSKSTQHYAKKRVTATVKVSHKPAGKVVLYDGAKKLTTLTLKKGKATYVVPAKLAKGSHKLHAVFVPKKPLAYAPSTSKTLRLRVVK